MSDGECTPGPDASLLVAAALALASAVSLGLARFSYALLLPPMRADLGWSYLVAGSMNTVNAAGYLLGAWLAPLALARHDARTVMLAGSVAAALLLIGHGAVLGDAPLFALRFLTGVASAAAFVGGGLVAARLAQAASAAPPVAGRADESSRQRSAPSRAGLILGIFYGGTGAGIIASAVLVPPLVARVAAHAWQAAWLALGIVALVATAVTTVMTRHLAAPRTAASRMRFEWRPLGFALASYFMFGLGYIGYMTFVITLLREQHLAPSRIAAFYGVLGLAVIASPWLWAALLQRARGGGALTILNALLAVATVLPVLSSHPVAVFGSALLFGGVFLSLVASTTALVRHNLPPAAWPAGIGAFTVVFAAGQIVGPSLVGWVADGPGGLSRGFVVSALVLGIGALLATRQKPLAA